jgi:type II secretory pathway pseudopilin PulG
MSATGDGGFETSGEAGTTLIEALVVVSILALVGLIAFPRLQQGFQVLSERQAMSQVEARLRQSRAEALRRDEPVAFTAAAVSPPGVALAVDGGGPITFFGDGSSSGGVVRVFAGRRTLAIMAVSPQGGAMTVRPG